jgi:hypothetical protein
MARRKRTSDSIARAETRAAGLSAIDPKLDLGNGMTLDDYRISIADAKAVLDKYNTALSQLDSQLNAVENSEVGLDELSARMLAAVGVKYGKDSDEYEQAGGTRSSERKSPQRNSTSAPTVAKA